MAGTTVNTTGRMVAHLRLEKAEALRDLVQVRLQPPERDRTVEDLDRVIASIRSRRPAQDDMLRAAREKAVQAEADREEKRKPYEADPLFMYLWGRRYGTRDYQAIPLVRYFDRKVAHLIGFEEARVNYTLLMELPERLREHADRLRSGEGGSIEDEALESVERRPEIAALLAAPGRPGDEIARRIAEIDAALKRMTLEG
jgi:hypothetical protein